MNLRNALVLLGLLCALLFWLALHPTPEPASASPGQTTIAQASRCPLPPRIERGGAPLQTAVPGGMALPAIGNATMRSGHAPRASLTCTRTCTGNMRGSSQLRSQGPKPPLPASPR